MNLSTVANFTIGVLSNQLEKNVKEVECRDVHNYNSSFQCNFVNSTADCYVEEGYIQYVIFLYCRLHANLLPLAITILIFWLLFLFVALAVAADNFFCPSLEVIAQVLRMSDNIAGVTLLAFGNGAPDVFSAISAVENMKGGDVGMVFGALLGAGVFLTTAVIGSVTLVKPFHAMERPFLRDIIFYIVTVFFTFWICHNGVIYTPQALAYIGSYAFYVVVVIVGRLIYKRQMYLRNRSPPIITDVSENDVEEVADIQRANGSLPNGCSESTPLLGNENSRTVALHGLSDDLGIDLENDSNAWKDFMYAIFPIDIQEWKSDGGKNYMQKICAVFKSPALFLLKLTVPLVDNKAPKHNWNKPLNTLHCIVTPVFCIFAASSDFALQKIGVGVPIFVIFVACGIFLAIVVFLTSQMDTPPVYHPVFAFIGFFAAVMWIKNIANEIVNLLQAAGVVFSISNTILGLTFLAWGNSIGDLISDIAVARRGLPRAGFSACIGGPLFNTMLGIGIPFSMATYKNGGFMAIHFTSIQLFLFISLAVSLISSLVVIPLMKFNLKRPYGIYLIVLYIVFLTIAILIESNVIQWTI